MNARLFHVPAQKVKTTKRRRVYRLEDMQKGTEQELKNRLEQTFLGASVQDT
jgi:hypothetical protein